MTEFKDNSLSSSCIVSHLTPLAPSTVERCAGGVVGGQVWLPSLISGTSPCVSLPCSLQISSESERAG